MIDHVPVSTNLSSDLTLTGDLGLIGDLGVSPVTVVTCSVPTPGANSVVILLEGSATSRSVVVGTFTSKLVNTQ